MRIAHLNNPANVAWTLSRAQRALGHDAVVYDLMGSPYGFPADIRVRGYRGTHLWNFQMARRWREFLRYDVLHVHHGMQRSEVVYPLFALACDKTLVAHFHGDDVRLGTGLHYLRAADVPFVSTPDLVSRVPGSTWLPNPVDPAALPAAGPANDPPRLCHLPTDPALKGTAELVAAFRAAFPEAEASREGDLEWHRAPRAELVVGSRTSHARALQLLASCDAVFDQLSPHGAYGMVALEGMALGKPVLASVRPEFYDRCPVVPVDRDSLAGRVAEVMGDEALRRTIGREGRAYAERVHGARRIAERTLLAYSRGDAG